jgi:hypothetical protein
LTNIWFPSSYNIEHQQVKTTRTTHIIMKYNPFLLLCVVAVFSVAKAFNPSRRFQSTVKPRHSDTLRILLKAAEEQSEDYYSEKVIDLDSLQPNSTIFTQIRRRITERNKNGIQNKKNNRQELAKLGANVLLAYGFVSNAFGCVSVSCAWYIASKRVSNATDCFT